MGGIMHALQTRYLVVVATAYSTGLIIDTVAFHGLKTNMIGSDDQGGREMHLKIPI